MYTVLQYKNHQPPEKESYETTEQTYGAAKFSTTKAGSLSHNQPQVPLLLHPNFSESEVTELL